MSFYLIGINHKTASIDLRTKLAFAAEEVSSALKEIHAQPWAHEVVILSTCNRTEWYCHLSDEQHAQFYEWIKSSRALSEDEWDASIYTYREESAIKHLMRVACGLDSMVMGEPQILGQLKTAYGLAKSVGTISAQLERLFQQTFAVAKRVRTETSVGANAVSVAYAAVNLSKHIFSDIAQTRALLIGAGDTIERVARHFFEQGVKSIMVANRTLDRAIQLAESVNGHAMALTEIPETLKSVDIVVSSTASSLPILGKGAIESALSHGKRRPLFMVDLAVPRDIEPEVASIEDVYLYSVDDLEGVIAENRKEREKAAMDAEQIISNETIHYQSWLRSLDTVTLIRDYRDKMSIVRDREVKKAVARISRGETPQDVIAELARSLTNKFMHVPCKQVKQAGYDGKTDVLEVFQELMQLKELQDEK